MLRNETEFQQEVTQKTGFLGWASSSAQPPVDACHVFSPFEALRKPYKAEFGVQLPPYTHTARTSSRLVSHTTGEGALNSLRQTRPL